MAQFKGEADETVIKNDTIVIDKVYGKRGFYIQVPNQTDGAQDDMSKTKVLPLELKFLDYNEKAIH